MSSLLNSIIGFVLLLSKNFGRTADPIMNAANPIASVMVKLVDIEFIDSNKNIENSKITISGLNI